MAPHCMARLDLVNCRDLQLAEQGGQDDLTVPDEVGDVLDRLQVVCLLGVRDRLLLQSLGVITFESWLIRC